MGWRRILAHWRITTPKTSTGMTSAIRSHGIKPPFHYLVRRRSQISIGWYCW